MVSILRKPQKNQAKSKAPAGTTKGPIVTKRPQPRKGMTIIDGHPREAWIRTQVLEGKMTIKQIAKEIGVSDGTIKKYIQLRMGGELMTGEETRKRLGALSLEEEIRRIMFRMYKLYDACDRYLQNPDKPDEYDLLPRAWEIQVTYKGVNDNGNIVLMRDNLQNLLTATNEEDIVSVEFKYKDPRELIIKTAHALTDSITKISHVLGISPTTFVNKETHIDLKQILIEATTDREEIRDAIINRLKAYAEQ
jgi:plasmid maintenance system antidote protein VapI